MSLAETARSGCREVGHSLSFCSSSCSSRIYFVLLLGLSQCGAAVAAMEAPSSATAGTFHPFPRPRNRYGEDHKFGIMLGLIVSVGAAVVIGVSLFAQCCTEDQRRRDRQRRRWAAAAAAVDAGRDGAEPPAPPSFHLVSPRMRRRLRRWLRRWRRRRRHLRLPPPVASAVDADDDDVDERRAAAVAAADGGQWSEDTGSSLSSSSSDVEGDAGDDDADAAVVAARRERDMQRLRWRLGPRSSVAVPPAYPGPRATTTTTTTTASVAAASQLGDDGGGGGPAAEAVEAETSFCDAPADAALPAPDAGRPAGTTVGCEVGASGGADNQAVGGDGDGDDDGGGGGGGGGEDEDEQRAGGDGMRRASGSAAEAGAPMDSVTRVQRMLRSGRPELNA